MFWPCLGVVVRCRQRKARPSDRWLRLLVGATVDQRRRSAAALYCATSSGDDARGPRPRAGEQLGQAVGEVARARTPRRWRRSRRPTTSGAAPPPAAPARCARWRRPRGRRPGARRTSRGSRCPGRRTRRRAGAARPAPRAAAGSTTRPISSASSRTAAARRLSPSSTPPPGVYQNRTSPGGTAGSVSRAPSSSTRPAGSRTTTRAVGRHAIGRLSHGRAAPGRRRSAPSAAAPPAGRDGGAAVRRSDSARRQRAIAAWSPESSTGGTSCPRQDAGRV